MFDCLDELEDKRKDINKEYELLDIVFLTMAAVASGAQGWKDIHLFGKSKLSWLRQFRPFTSGIPTRHSIGRIIRGISAEALMQCFAQWIRQQRDSNGAQHIAFDGKTLRGSGRNKHKDALHLMSALVVDSGLMLYQSESMGKKNEIKTMEAMLDIIPLKGHVISPDAMHCQTKTLEKAQANGADAVLQLKGNQKRLRDEVAAYFHKVRRDTADKVESISEIDSAHGRSVERRYCVIPSDEWVSALHQWSGVTSLIEVQRTHHRDEHSTTETSYYLSTLSDIKRNSEVIRNHWKIESHHWMLDVTFKEDESQIYALDGAKNMALFRRMLLTMAKAHPLKDSMAGKLKRAGWDDSFRAELLFG